MKNKLILLVTLVLNLVLSFFIMKVSDGSLFYLFVDLIVWCLLYFLYEFMHRRKIDFDKELFTEYVFYYLLNFFVMLNFFIFLKVGFLRTKVIFIVFIVLLLFIQDKFDKFKFNKIIPYLILLNTTLLFGLVSPMSPVGNKNSLTDSSVFRYIGTLMTEGKVPYLDVFDHKGMFLYVINYLGIKLSKNVGIWIIEMIMLYLTGIFSYKLARLFTNKFNSIVATIVAFIPLIYTFEGGNYTEEYALLFIVLSLYLFTRDIIKDKFLNLKSAFVIGMCLGAILMLRPNMIAIWICMSIYLLVLYLRNKKYKDLIRLILYFILGILVFISPLLIYLLYNGAIEEFFEQYILFNFKYSNRNANTLFDTYSYFIKNCKYVYVAVVIYLISILKYKNNRSLIYFYISIVVLSFILILMPKNLYGHYGMVIIPTYVVGFAIMFDCIYYDAFKFIQNKSLKMIFIVMLIVSFVYNDIVIFSDYVNDRINEMDIYKWTNDIIQDNTTKDDNILVYGNSVIVYLKSNRRTNQKYPYQIPILEVDDKIKDEFYENIVEDNPKLIITKKENIDSLYKIFPFVKKKYKELEFNDLNFVVYKLIKDKN